MSGDRPNPPAGGRPAFTPGPWELHAQGSGQFVYAPGSQPRTTKGEHGNDVQFRTGLIALVYSTEGSEPVPCGAQAANARLIAAAPDLLEALHKLAAEVVGLRAFESELRAELGNINWNALMLRLSEADAAIAKAEGRT